ncbi:EEF1A lysine methyltransferase 2-like [Panonychus citri]|uniref:EEF1A lysine methyltransferase 2-like n=1 Tax=Panonychus citri TaxID=50023 RepID=UPI002307E648|nr:EEF1A lysine methyltransferase 2-like [Panonychus citri]XP_053201802.1 EEF1A lysine methyltransferase 2-like [Panonychus citri]
MEESTINSSILGTKEYWENLYQQEINNYLDHSDPGEIWFGKGLTMKMVKWIKSKSSQLLPDDGDQIKILDLGCGNGHLLYSLYQQGYTDLTGLDYADKSIKLVNQMASDLGIVNNLKTYVADVLTLYKSNLIPERIKFNLIIDKGTFDAICLNPDLDLNQVKSDYLATLEAILFKGRSFFMIASCNWTKDELINMFTKSSQSFLSLYDEIETPQFSFGGSKGNNVTCLIFQRLS